MGQQCLHPPLCFHPALQGSTFGGGLPKMMGHCLPTQGGKTQLPCRLPPSHRPLIQPQQLNSASTTVREYKV